MTTKIKIISGFLIMMLLIAIVAFAGYRAISTGNKIFEEYARLSELNVSYSDIVAQLKESAVELEKFRSAHDSAHIDASIAAIEEAGDIAKKVLVHIVIPERMTATRQLISELGLYRPLIEAVRDNVISVRKKYDEFNLIMQEFRKGLLELSELAVKAGDPALLRDFSNMWDALAVARVNIGRHSESLDAKQASAAATSLEDFRKTLHQIDALVVSPAGRRLADNLLVLEKRFSETFRQQDEFGRKAVSSLEETYKLDTSALKLASSLSEALNVQMHDYLELAMASNASAQRQVLILSIIGLLIGTAIAAFIIINLIRTLQKLGNYATAVAGGNFEATSGIKEKGDIGKLITSLDAIPFTLNSVMAEYTKVEKAVESGDLNIQGDASAFSGGFAKLMQGTNSILTRFLGLIDNIPSPVVILNKDLKANYLNNIAQEIAGRSYKGKTCGELMALEDDGSPNSALKKTVETGKPSSAETIAHPQGKTMDVSYTVIPMFGADGKLVAVGQLFTDLTTIKNTQRTIMQVAAQAMEISDRVAAASEELSAQVEQVSRGAELQRERVDSTASAMNEMNSTVLEVARNAGQASEQSDGTRQHAEQGQTIVNKVVSAMNSVNNVSLRLQKNMEELGSQAENVGGVMNVISDIADQTNLLALNAAIEAARAGEAGRGFAVVADEVRKLAEKTMSATQEVGNNISAIQTSTKHNIDEVGQAVSSITQATELANKSGEALQGIVRLAAETSSLVTSIATAAEEQSQTSEEITRAIDEISQVVGETSEGMIQSSAAVQELARLAQTLNTVMDQLKSGDKR